MDYDYSKLVEQTQYWTQQAQLSNWIDDNLSKQINLFETQTSATLFLTETPGLPRPLIAAFIGGTGVGKSSLLNRLAGKAIAKAGVVRPTSREVTLYHHHYITIQQLPKSLALDETTICQHDDDSKKNIVWIDMPDFDSTESNNKKLVQQWLPHIDVLIYVVSPERYKDQKAWQLLLSEGTQHAWLFAFNQWDKGQNEQFDDFTQQIHKAGFVTPIIFKTTCTTELHSDEFSALEATLNSLSTSHIVKQLEDHSTHIRKLDLEHKLISVKNSMGSILTAQQIPELWLKQWLLTKKTLQEGLAWPIQNLATYSAEHASDILSPQSNVFSSLWDNWAQSRFDDALTEFIVSIDQLEIPVTPFKRQLHSMREDVATIVQTQTELATRHALINPGNLIHRNFLKGMRLCELILPLMAMAWVAYKVLISYYTSNLIDNHYLGIDFAVHSGLLIALTWLIPFFILKKAQPSLKNSALKGLNKGLQSAFKQIDNEITLRISSTLQEHKKQLDEISVLIEHCRSNEIDHNLSITSNDSSLTRMLMK